MKSLSIILNISHRHLGITLAVVLSVYAILSLLPSVSFAAERQLERGMYGEDVRLLQVLLNSDALTQVSESGAGSIGNETTFFGKATEEALVRFQQKNLSDVLDVSTLGIGIGVYGPITKSFVSERMFVSGISDKSRTVADIFLSQSTDTLKSATSATIQTEKTALEIVGLSEGSVVTGEIVVEANPKGLSNKKITQVVFQIDNVVVRTEKIAPYSLGSSRSDLSSIPFNFSAYEDGKHTLTVTVFGDELSWSNPRTNVELVNKTLLFSTKKISKSPATISVVKTNEIEPVKSPILPANSRIVTQVNANAVLCSNENTECKFSGTREIRYGIGSKFFTKTLSNGTACTNKVFSDPIVGVKKLCYVVNKNPNDTSVPIETVTQIKPEVIQSTRPVPVLVIPVQTVTNPVPVIPTAISTAVPVPKPVAISSIEPVPASVTSVISAPATGDKNMNVLANKGAANDSLGCEIVNQYYIESKKEAKYKWKSFNADKVTVNGKPAQVSSGDLLTSEIPFNGTKATVFELVVSKGNESKTCRVVVPPILAKCTATITDNTLDKTLADYRVTFPAVPGAPYQLSLYNSRGILFSTYSTGELANATSITYTGKIPKTAVADKKEIQFLTRMYFPTNLMASILNNSRCVTKYVTGPVNTVPTQGSTGSGSGDGYTSTPSAPRSGTTPSSPSSPRNGGGLGTPSTQNGLLNF